jgi:hypothetical protein
MYAYAGIGLEGETTEGYIKTSRRDSPEQYTSSRLGYQQSIRKRIGIKKRKRLEEVYAMWKRACSRPAG